MIRDCLTCGTPFPAKAQPKAPGRPRSYCSPGCYPWKYNIRWSEPGVLPARADSMDTPLKRAAAHQAIQRGEAHGWSPSTIAGVMHGLALVLADATEDQPVPASRIRERVPRGSSIARVTDVLADMQLLHVDTGPSIHRWIETRTAELPAGFAPAIRAWLFFLLDGDARTRPKTKGSLYVQFGCVKPIVLHLATTRDHLREVTAGDITEALGDLNGHKRRNAITAVRSLFWFAKKKGLVFRDPARHLPSVKVAPVLVPLTEQEIRAIGQSVVTPAQRLVVTLAAAHAARATPIRHLTLADIDLPGRRITIDGHEQLMGELTTDALVTWLAFRNATWPGTANPHVLINKFTALGTAEISHYCLKRHLLLKGIQLERIRKDRILHEALAADADPLHLALVFNISHTTAVRYAEVATAVLSATAEADPTPPP
ncbi:integrase [Pseudonocardiaceae bacterium YIM PH 21723]|nr:integrase [Pseudonocardiaceae bacterium YIM PH 21723]